MPAQAKILLYSFPFGAFSYCLRRLGFLKQTNISNGHRLFIGTHYFKEKEEIRNFNFAAKKFINLSLLNKRDV
jgi:hypothetical protein